MNICYYCLLYFNSLSAKAWAWAQVKPEPWKWVGSRFCDPEAAEAKPKPRLLSQSQPAHHYAGARWMNIKRGWVLPIEWVAKQMKNIEGLPSPIFQLRPWNMRGNNSSFLATFCHKERCIFVQEPISYARLRRELGVFRALFPIFNSDNSRGSRSILPGITLASQVLELA